MDNFLTSIATPFEGMLEIPELGLLLIFVIFGMWFSLETVFTKKK